MRIKKELDIEEFLNRKVRTYRNLQTGTMSVLARQRNSKGAINWLLAGHTTDLMMKDVKFHVSEGGRQRTIARRRRNVHAWAEGILIAVPAQEIETPIDVAYNPFVTNTFVKRYTSVPIVSAKYLAVKSNLVWCSSDAIANKWTVLSSLDAIVQQASSYSYSYANLIAA
jgi:hypothetical protein